MNYHEKSKKKRADQILVELGLVETRSRAAALIMTSQVYVRKNELEQWEKVEKAGSLYRLDLVDFKVNDNSSKDVSRGALKLRGALNSWHQINLSNSICLDVGASTGGFTQVCLEKGASFVLALDVGTHQLHEKMRANDKVFSFEKQHILKTDLDLLKEKKLPIEYDFICSDLSFISIKKVISHCYSWLKKDAHWVFLLKPQFELSADKLHKGIVRDPVYTEEAIKSVKEVVESILDLKWMDIQPSDIKGTKGNQEYLVWIKRV